MFNVLQLPLYLFKKKNILKKKFTEVCMGRQKFLQGAVFFTVLRKCIREKSSRACCMYVSVYV